MALTVICPKCSARVAIPPGAQGKKVRCPDPECGAVLAVAAPKNADTFKLADAGPEPPPPEELKAKKRKRSFAEEMEEAAADYEVLVDGEIVRMSYPVVQAALRKGTINRFTPIRPLDDLHKDPQSIYGFTRRRKREHPWRCLGNSGLADEHRSSIYSHDGIIKIVGGAVYAVLALVIVVSIYRLEADPARVREAVLEERSGDWRIRMMRHAIVVSPEAYVALLKLTAMGLALLYAVPIAFGVGWVAGLAFGVAWYFRYRAELHSAGYPPDGYPAMFWKGWRQRWLLRRALWERRRARK
jgi:hypothetical protein